MTAALHPSPSPAAHPRLAMAGRIARGTLATCACLWLALCTAVGPLYWADSSIADFGPLNAAYFLLSFLIYLGIVLALVRWANGVPVFGWHRARRQGEGHEREPRRIVPPGLRMWSTSWAISRPGMAMRRFLALLGRGIVRGTDRWWKIALILFLGWLWAPTTLLAAFGADIRSQIREFSWAWNQWTGLKQPYIGFFSFVPMDIYPTAHYMWPDDPTYLTDQHNIVLTLVYGAAAAISRYLTGSNDWGIVALAAAQFLFAVFCVAATANRFLNLRPIMAPADSSNPSSPSDPSRTGARDRIAAAGATPAGGFARVAIILFFLLCPLAVFSTISLTKSPLFAFAFTWWFGIWYELHLTRRAAGRQRGDTPRLPRRTVLAFALSTVVMLVSAKYAWYIVALQIVLALIADRRRWGIYVTALLLPVILVHGGTALAIQSGAIIGGDPIESRGVQLQMIARVAQRDPEAIPQSAKDRLAPVFNLDQMADAYSSQDADPVKSSGIQSKKVSYRWRTVTPEDMERFNEAWLQIVKASPVVALDALLAKSYGYFDIADLPYVSMAYYVDSDYVQQNSTWIRYVNHDWRQRVAAFADAWSAVPVLGWPTHGNFYVILTLLIGAAEVMLRRWRSLAWHIPLLLLMGVMITAPANNFERHMLPVAFVFGFLCLTFWRESRAARAQADAPAAMEVVDGAGVGAAPGRTARLES